MEKVLSIKGLNKRFGRLHAVKDLDLEVYSGNVYGILGPNGSGKSTTLGMILHVINPSSGHWEWFGEPSSTYSLTKIGAIIENPNFYPYLSAYRNLEIVSQIKKVPIEKIDEKLELVGLLDRKNDKYSTYSLGMKQRLAIASALLNDPQVLILDEPTNGLDPAGIIQIRDLIREIASKGTTILLASHLLDEVEKVCSHVIVLREGATIYSGSVDEMTASKGYYELKADQMEQLASVLNEMKVFQKVIDKDGLIQAFIENEIEPATLNKNLMEKGITLTHLVKRKETLENQFLEITKNI